MSMMIASGTANLDRGNPGSVKSKLKSTRSQLFQALAIVDERQRSQVLLVDLVETVDSLASRLRNGDAAFMRNRWRTRRHTDQAYSLASWTMSANARTWLTCQHPARTRTSDPARVSNSIREIKVSSNTSKLCIYRNELSMMTNYMLDNNILNMYRI